MFIELTTLNKKGERKSIMINTDDISTIYPSIGKEGSTITLRSGHDERIDVEADFEFLSGQLIG